MSNKIFRYQEMKIENGTDLKKSVQLYSQMKLRILSFIAFCCLKAESKPRAKLTILV